MKIFAIVGLFALAIPAIAQTDPDERDPLIAAVIVYTASYSIERWQKYCSTEFPSTSLNIAAARSAWMDSHMDLLQMAGSILKSRLTKEERTQVGVQARLTNDDLERKLNAAPMGARKDWCEQSPQRIAAPQMDLHRRTVLVNTLETFSQ